MPTRIVILGSTGSIGRSALDVVRAHPGRFEIVGLSAQSNTSLLAVQAHEFNPKLVAVGGSNSAVNTGAFGGATVFQGPQAVAELAAHPCDLVLCAIVGAAGLVPVLNAIDAGNRVALANKEPMVMAGPLIMERAHARGVRVLPVDSEHNAIFQCLEGHSLDEVHRIHLTASGGPFYGKPRESLRGVTPEQAVRHPTWNMGAKISVDSATLMNKGLEVIEAMHLFGLPLDRFKVVIHPQSIVHSLVEFVDGGMLAHLGVTDMRLPIQFALTWPERVKSQIARLDLAALSPITFAEPDFSEFPCLALAFEAARRGGTAPAILNAANEAAVEAFREGRIAFLDIARVVEEVLESAPQGRELDLESVLAADANARRLARAAVETTGVT